MTFVSGFRLGLIPDTDLRVIYDPERALQLLRIGYGRADATFRNGQEDAIRHVVGGQAACW